MLPKRLTADGIKATQATIDANGIEEYICDEDETEDFIVNLYENGSILSEAEVDELMSSKVSADRREQLLTQSCLDQAQNHIFAVTRRLVAWVRKNAEVIDRQPGGDK